MPDEKQHDPKQEKDKKAEELCSQTNPKTLYHISFGRRVCTSEGDYQLFKTLGFSDKDPRIDIPVGSHPMPPVFLPPDIKMPAGSPTAPIVIPEPPTDKPDHPISITLPAPTDSSKPPMPDLQPGGQWVLVYVPGRDFEWVYGELSQAKPAAQPTKKAA